MNEPTLTYTCKYTDHVQTYSITTAVTLASQAHLDYGQGVVELLRAELKSTREFMARLISVLDLTDEQLSVLFERYGHNLTINR